MNILTNLFAPSKVSPSAQPIKKHRGIHLKSPEEIVTMRQASAIVATVLKEIEAMVEPGMTTGDLDTYAEKRIRALGATPSFKGYHGFPASICASLNSEAVHGIPSQRRKIRAGDLLKVDTGAYFQGYHGDSCITIAVGTVSKKAERLIKVAEEAMWKGIAQVKAGHCLLDIAGAIEDHTKKHGFTIIEEFTGHGVGRNLHEDPCVFNVRTRQLPNVQLKAGMTLAIEPILNAGSRFTRTLQDRWTVVTVDNSLSAQFEHTVLVTATGCEILTDRDQV